MPCYRPFFLVCLLSLFSLSLHAMTAEQKAMLNKLDLLDQIDFDEQVTLAQQCLKRSKLSCAKKHLGEAQEYITREQDEATLAKLDQAIASKGKQLKFHSTLAQAKDCMQEFDFACVKQRLASSEKLVQGFDDLDALEQLEKAVPRAKLKAFSYYQEKAQACIDRNRFGCASDNLDEASEFALNTATKDLLSATKGYMRQKQEQIAYQKEQQLIAKRQRIAKQKAAKEAQENRAMWGAIGAAIAGGAAAYNGADAESVHNLMDNTYAAVAGAPPPSSPGDEALKQRIREAKQYMAESRATVAALQEQERRAHAQEQAQRKAAYQAKLDIQAQAQARADAAALAQAQARAEAAQQRQLQASQERARAAANRLRTAQEHRIASRSGSSTADTPSSSRGSFDNYAVATWDNEPYAACKYDCSKVTSDNRQISNSTAVQACQRGCSIVHWTLSATLNGSKFRCRNNPEEKMQRLCKEKDASTVQYCMKAMNFWRAEKGCS